MTKLSDTQLVLLSAAAQREDRTIPIGERLKGGVAKSIGSKLISLGVAEERIVIDAALSWRTDNEGQHVALVITKEGLDAIGVESEGEEPIAAAPSSATSRPAAEARSGTKRAMIIDLLKREEGASLDDMIAATGWLQHTTRAALTGLRKKGFDLIKTKDEAGKTRYRVAGPAHAQESPAVSANTAADVEAASHEG